MSFALCNNVFHTITVGRASTNYTITVDSNAAVTRNIGTTSITGTLYVGGKERFRSRVISLQWRTFLGGHRVRWPPILVATKAVRFKE